MVESIEELKKKIEMLERFHTTPEHKDETPEDNTPSSPNIKEFEEPEPEPTKKELPKEDEQEIEPVDRDDEGNPIEDDEDEEEEDDDMTTKERLSALEKYIIDMTKENTQLKKEKEKLKPPVVIKTPMKEFTCEKCGYPLGNRQFVPCGDCGWKMKTQLEKDHEAERLKKEQEQIKMKQEDERKRIKMEEQEHTILIVAGKLRHEIKQPLTLGTKIIVSQLESLIKPPIENTQPTIIDKIQEWKKMEQEDGYHIIKINKEK